MPESPPGGSVAVEVWWARTGRHPWEALATLLDAREQGRLQALRREADKERFVLAAALARAAVGARLGVAAADVALDRTCARCGEPHGKPAVSSPAVGLELSITHSGEVVGVALARGVPVGLDVEALERSGDLHALEASVLAPVERTALDRIGPADARERMAAFLRMWTRKEALTKMAGVGITVPLADVVVSAEDGSARCVAWPDGAVRPAEVTLRDLDPPAPGHLAAVAAGHPAAAVYVRDGEAALSVAL